MTEVLNETVSRDPRHQLDPFQQHINKRRAEGWTLVETRWMPWPDDNTQELTFHREKPMAMAENIPTPEAAVALLKERMDRVERLLLKLAFALERKDSERDGNWGYAPFVKEMHEIVAEMCQARGLTGPWNDEDPRRQGVHLDWTLIEYNSGVRAAINRVVELQKENGFTSASAPHFARVADELGKLIGKHGPLVQTQGEVQADPYWLKGFNAGIAVAIDKISTSAPGPIGDAIITVLASLGRPRPT